MRIVIADDNSVMRAKLRSAFKMVPRAEIIAEVETGLEAYRAVVDLHPDLVCLDVQMLQMTGIEVARKLRDEGNETRVLLVSSMAQKAVAGSGEFELLAKPFHATQLIQKIYDIFGEASLA